MPDARTGSTATQPTETMVSKDLKYRIDGLPTELHDMITSFVFKSDTFALETSPIQFSTPYVHNTTNATNATKTLRITRIDHSWRPAHWMQVDRASHAAFSHQLFNNNAIFIFPNIEIMKSWIKSLSTSGLEALPKLKVHCVQYLEHENLEPVTTLDPESVGNDAVHQRLADSTLRAHLYLLEMIERVTEQCFFCDWLGSIVGPAEFPVFIPIKFVKSEGEIFEAAE